MGVILCVYLSVTTLAATYLVCTSKKGLVGFLWHFSDLQHAGFPENALFKLSSGVTVR